MHIVCVYTAPLNQQSTNKYLLLVPYAVTQGPASNKRDKPTEMEMSKLEKYFLQFAYLNSNFNRLYIKWNEWTT